MRPALLLLGCLLACPLQAAELLLVNGRIWTGDTERPEASAMAVRDGRVVAVGDDGVVATTVSRDATRIDLGGRRVVPGINDAHVHLGASPPSTRLDVPGMEPGGDEVEAALRALPVNGAGWITAEIGTRVWLDPDWHRQRLDTLQPTRPVMLRMFTGHGVILNTAAQRALDIDPEETIPGGWFGRDATGAFNGRLYEYAQWRTDARQPPLPDEAEIAALRGFSDETVQLGITSLQAMVWLPLDRAHALWQQSGARQRLRLIRFPLLDDPGTALQAPDALDHDPLARIHGTKWIIDGTAVDQTAPLRQPYAVTGDAARLNFDRATIVTLLREILARDDQPLLHVFGDATADAVLDAMEAIAPAQTWRQRRVRFEHGDGLTPDLLQRAAGFGIVVVQNPTHLAVPEAHPFTALVRERGFQPLSDIERAGLTLALGSDGPANPWLNLMLATAPTSRPDQALTREQALRAYTSGSAFAEFTEHEKGKLVAGHVADFAVLSQDVLDPQLPAQALPATRSLLTVVDGEIAWRDPDF
jgi:predicted amidohydrolase YtcJ